MSRIRSSINIPSVHPVIEDTIKEEDETDSDESQPLLTRNTIFVESDDEPLNDGKIITCSGRLVCVWLVSFIFMLSYHSSSFAFGHYTYNRLQKQSHPNFTTESDDSKCETNTSSPNHKLHVDVQKQAAEWRIFFTVAGGITAIISNFVLGAFTDRYGRKFLFVYPCFGTLCRTLISTVLMQYNLPLYYHVLGYFIEGCTGQIFSISQVAFIYASDITVPGKQRSFAICSIELAFGVGTALPAVGVGYIMKETDSCLIPMYIASGMLVLALLCMIVLPETYPREVRMARQYLTFCDNLKDAISLYFSEKNLGKRWMYCVMLTVFALTSYNIYGRAAVDDLYLLNDPFCFGPNKVGIYDAMKEGLQQFAGIILVTLLLMCTSDGVVAIIGCVSFGASFIVEGFATSDMGLYIVSVVGCCGLLTVPMVRSVMSQMTSPEQQGAVFASISATETMVNLISSVSSNTIYLETISIYRGFIFFVYAAISGICIVLLIIYVMYSKTPTKTFIEFEYEQRRRTICEETRHAYEGRKSIYEIRRQSILGGRKFYIYDGKFLQK